MNVSAQPLTEDAQAVGRRGLRLMFVCLGLFMVYLDSTVVNVALPQIQSDMGVSVSELQWVFDSYVLTFACFLLSSGTLGDVFGRRRTFLVGLIGFTLASAACALSSDITTLLISRFVQGAFGAVMITTSLALVHTMYSTPRGRARAVSIWAGIGGLAIAAGPVLGGVLVEQSGWPSIFWVNVPIGTLSIAAILLLRFPPEPRRPRHLDMIGQLLFAAAVASLTFGLIQASTGGWTVGRVLASFVVAGVATLLFLWREWRCAEPMLPLASFRNRVMVFACAINFLVYYGLFGAMFLLTLYLQSVNGLSAVETGIRFLALSVTIAVGSLISPRLAQRAGRGFALISAAGAVAASLGLFGLLRLHTGSGYGTYWWALVLLGLGIAFAMGPATIALLASVQPDLLGRAAGVSQTFRQIGGVLGVALSGTLALQHLRHGLPTAFADLDLPPSVRTHLVSTFSSGHLTVTGELPVSLRAVVASRVDPLLVDSMTVAFAVGACVALAGVLTPLLLLRGKDQGRENPGRS